MKTLDPKVIIVFFIKNFLGTVYIFPIWFIGVFILEKIWTNDMRYVSKDLVLFVFDSAGIIFFSLLLFGCYYWAWLTVCNFTYEFQSDGLHVYRGVIIKRHMIMPYTNIESVELLVNPLVVRFLDLYTVQIKTRELLNTEGIFRKKQKIIIPGIPSEIARTMRAELLKNSHIQTTKKTFFDPVSGQYR